MALDLFAWSDTGDRAVAYEDGTIGDRMPVRSGENVGGGDQHVTRFSSCCGSVGGAQGIGQGEELLHVSFPAARARQSRRRGRGCVRRYATPTGVPGCAELLSHPVNVRLGRHRIAARIRFKVRADLDQAVAALDEPAVMPTVDATRSPLVPART